MLTVGHGTQEQEAFATLLRGAGVAHLVEEAGIAYHHERDLGGFRTPLPDSPNAGWRNDSFRGQADHLRTPPFWAALDRVLALDRTHRRLIADAVTVVRERPVEHLMPDGRTAPHRPTEGVVREGDFLRYPG